MVDANHCFNVPQAVNIGRELEKLNVYWFEEPISPEDLDGYVEVSRRLDMARPKILVTLPTVESGRKLLEPVAELVVAPDPSPATLYRMVGDADALVVRTQLPADLLDRPHRLLGIVRHGTGLDLIPVEAATAQAIPVANVPGVNAETVAEYCIGALLTLARRMHTMDRELRDIGWNESRKHADFAIELFGRTLGVVGVGDIGRRVAEIGHSAFGMRILGY
jgi:D-3-phosphoglycerate dehydrogenase